MSKLLKFPQKRDVHNQLDEALIVFERKGVCLNRGQSASVLTFLRKSSLYEVLESIEITHQKSVELGFKYVEDYFRYFCGVMHNKLKAKL